MPVQDQFFDFASTMVSTGPDAFFARIGRSALVNTMVLPGASYGLKKVRLPCGTAHTHDRFCAGGQRRWPESGQIVLSLGSDGRDLVMATCDGPGIGLLSEASCGLVLTLQPVCRSSRARCWASTRCRTWCCRRSSASSPRRPAP